MASTERAVVVPPGVSLHDAATWVGHAAWTELRLHALLTRWLDDETDAELRTRLWAVRAHRAELAEAWHRRLPELREMPRGDRIVPRDPEVAGWFTRLDALTQPDDRRRAAASVLGALADGYEARRSVAVGPADGPTADTLRLAADRSRCDLELVGVAAGTAAVALP